MTSTFGRLSVFGFIIIGIIAYLTVGVRLFDNVRTSAIRIEMRTIDKSLYAHFLQRGRYPDELVAFLKRNLSSKTPRKVGKDIWGKAYRYQVTSDGYQLASAGGDKLFGSDDDVTFTRKANQTTLLVQKSGLSNKTRVASTIATVEGENELGELYRLLDVEGLKDQRGGQDDKVLAAWIGEMLKEALSVEN